MKRNLCKKVTVLFALISFGWYFSNAFANAPERVQVRLKTLLVSIEHYNLAPLAYGQNDIKELSALIQLRYGGQSQAVIDRPAGISPNIGQPIGVPFGRRR